MVEMLDGVTASRYATGLTIARGREGDAGEPSKITGSLHHDHEIHGDFSGSAMSDPAISPRQSGEDGSSYIAFLFFFAIHNLLSSGAPATTRQGGNS